METRVALLARADKVEEFEMRKAQNLAILIANEIFRRLT